MNYVDVILPLGIEGTYTYTVPKHLAGKVQDFVRVLVPLGKSKVYTGLIARQHDTAPTTADGQTVEVKDIIDVLDTEPVILPYQYKMWQWMSDYYLCPIGDIFRAAFPAGMKQEEGYRPKTETYIRLTPAYSNVPALHVALNMLHRAQQQLLAFNTFLSLAQVSEDHPTGTTPVTREELTNTAHTSSAIIKALIDRGLLETYEVEVGRLNNMLSPHPENIKPLSKAQQVAYDDICNSIQTSPKCPVLLQGVTGSGKTEIYIHLIQQTIDRGEQVLYLLPEIALTVQITSRLQRIFGHRMAIYHSRYSDAERVEVWHKQLSAQPFDIILGARSAVFLPFRRLGLIIVDEEHETSFKQQDPAPRYHARSMAIVMSRMTGSNPAVILGTATPSVESYFNAKHGKYHLVQLTERYSGLQLPHIEVVNTADLQRRKMMYGPFSPRLVEAMKDAIRNDRQIILFQNRRGFAPMIECHDCGWTPKCKNCDVTLTVHKVTGQLTCHYCGYTYTIPKKCPSCFCTNLREHGYGTERIEERLMEMQHLFTDDPDNQQSGETENVSGRKPLYRPLRISRMDLDTTRTKNAYERIISDFSAGRSNVLIGTQMVSKGLDFSRVSVVGILNADSMMNYPDFRAYEHAFQMMCQVSGRAGRAGSRGLVILQTRQPEQPLLTHVQANDYATFFSEQCEERQLFSYPPYARLIYVYLRHTKENVVESAALEMGGRLRQYLGSRVLGPDRPAVARIKSLCIRKLVLKLEQGIDLSQVRQCLRYVRAAIYQDKRYVSLQIYYDVDPE